MTESLGQQLRQARQKRNLSLEQIAYQTRIRLHYLQAIEDDAFDRLPSLAQARGFLRIYADHLGLDAEAMLTSLEGGAPSGSAESPPPPVTTPSDAKPSSGELATFFEEIGQRLIRQRELLGLSLDDVERHTHLRKNYLRALEAGDLDELPSPVQGRGMLNNYASFLGLDPEPLLLRFAEGLQARLAARQALSPRPTAPRAIRRSPPLLSRLFSRDLLAVGLLIGLLGSFFVWGAMRINDMRANGESTPTVPSVAEALLPTPEATASPTPTASPAPAGAAGEGGPPPTVDIAAQTTESAETALPTVESGAVQVQIIVHQRAWARITVDEKVAFEGRFLPGSIHTFTGQESIEILTGNGAGLQLIFNQRDLGAMGIYGEVVDRVFTPAGMLTPTPTITPTPTQTPTLPSPPEQTGTPQPPTAPG